MELVLFSALISTSFINIPNVAVSRPLSTFSPATFAILIFFCLSCNKNSADETQETKKALRVNEKTIEIPLDEQTSDYSFGLAYYHSDKPLLFNFNPIKKAVQVYDLKTQQLFKELTFKKEGSEGIGRLTGFFVQNLDSIFIFTNTPNTIYLTDLEQSYLSPISLKYRMVMQGRNLGLPLFIPTRY